MAADFYISGIRKDKGTGHIQQVKVIKDGTSNQLVTDREFVARLITLDRTTFQTIYWEDGKWRFGAKVHVINEVFLATDANAKKTDNLDYLPQF